MSIHLMELVQLRRFGRGSLGCSESIRKAAMLALANRADRRGDGIFAAVATLANLAGISERSLQKALTEFRREGLISEAGKRRCASGFVNCWRIDVQKVARLPQVLPREEFVIENSRQAHVVHPSSASGAPKPSLWNRRIAEPTDASKLSSTHDRQAQLLRLCEGFEEVISPDRDDEEWIEQIASFEARGFDFERHILPGARKFFLAHMRRKQRAGIWEPLRSLKHPGVTERIEKQAGVTPTGRRPSQNRFPHES